MGRSFEALWSTTIKRLPPCRVVIRPSGCTRSLSLSWLTDLPWFGYQVCLCISVFSPYSPNLFAPVSGLCSKVSFLSEILEWWLLHSSHVSLLCVAVSFEFCSGWPWQAFTQRPQESICCLGALCWSPLASSRYTQSTQWPWFTGDGTLHGTVRHVHVWSMLNLCFYHALDYAQL